MHNVIIDAMKVSKLLVRTICRLIMLSLVCVASHAAAQTLLNPGFEPSYTILPTPPSPAACVGVTGSLAINWKHNCLNPSPTIVYAQDVGRSGTASQKVTLQNSGTLQLVQDGLSFTANTVYSASVWMRKSSTTPSMAVQLQLQQNGGSNQVYGSRTISLTDTWTQYTLTTPTALVSGLFMIQATTPGTFWIDDANLTSSPELLNNSGFEPVPAYTAVPTCSNTARGFIANGWVNNCFGAASNVIYSQDIGRRGVSAQKLAVTQGIVQFVQFLTFNVVLTSDKLYTASVWMKSSTGTTPNIQVLLLKGDSSKVYAQRSFNLTDQWTEYRLTGAVESGAGMFMIQAANPMTIWVDDASLTAAPNLPQTTTIPGQYFGMHIHKLYYDNTTTAIPDPWHPQGGARMPINAVRLWDTDGAAWRTACPGPTPCPANNVNDPSWKWGRLDAQVARALATANGADLILTLGGATPAWASARPTECSPYSNTGGFSAEPSNDQYWKDWVTAVGTRYKGQIKYWEIWNEPHFDAQKDKNYDPVNNPNVPVTQCGNFFTGSAATLKRLSQQARDILKSVAIDPSLPEAKNQIVSPSFDALEYLQSYLKIGGGGSADIIGYHFYTCAKPEVTYVSDVPLIRSWVNSYDGSNKPLWNTEEGRLPGCTDVDDQTAAAYLARSFILKQAAGVGRYYFYAWDDQGQDIKLTNANYSTLTPAGTAYRQVANWLIGMKIQAVAVDANSNWTVTIINSGGTTSYIVWNPVGLTSFTIPSTWTTSLKKDLAGGSTSIPVNRVISLTGSPVLLVP